MTINFAIHKNIMTQILRDIYSDTSISPFLGFKGGTCVYFLYGLDRFSVDLDFDLLDLEKQELVFISVSKIIKDYGKVKDARTKRYSLFFLLSYQEDSPNLKIEINLRSFDSHYELKSYLGLSLLVMVREDMFARKLVAMYERFGKTNRDIYDIWFFLKNNWPINKQIVENRTEMEFSEFLHLCIKYLEHLSNRNILSGIGELLDVKQKTWAKENLLKETIFLLCSRRL